jgi:hypothetical protein
MSDENNAAEQQAPVTGDRPSGWFAFAEKPVMLQLKSPYIGCSYAYQPSMAEEGGVRATPILSGVLHVEPSGNGGIMLALQMPMEGSDFALIALSPDMIEYCTHLHQSRIIS